MESPDTRYVIFNKFVHKFSRLPTEHDPDYLEMLAMSKYRILAVPDVKPGKCANCGSSKNDGRMYIDFGLEVDWYGAVMLCSHCLKDIAKTAKLFAELEIKVLELELKLKNYENLREQGARLHENVASLGEEFKEYYGNLFALGDDPTPDNSSNVESDVSSPESGVDSTESISGKSESTVVEPPSVSGRKNVSKLADLLEKGR